MTAPLDPTDQALLDLLRADARRPVTDLARALGVARSTVQQRLERLERRGVIGGYTVRLGAAAAVGVRAQVEVVMDPRRGESVVTELLAVPGLRQLHAVSGPVDLIAVLSAPDAATLDGAIDRIGRIPGVVRTTTSVILSTKLDLDS